MTALHILAGAFLVTAACVAWWAVFLIGGALGVIALVVAGLLTVAKFDRWATQRALRDDLPLATALWRRR